MNYTENYHLPQWVRDDRIMMEDFNQMCADMEKGLTENRETAAGNFGALEGQTFDRLCRLAYNHYCFAQTVTPFPRQMGVFYQDTSKSGEGLEDMTKFDGFYGVCNNPDFTAEELFATFREISALRTTNGSAAGLVVQFTPPGSGSISHLPLYVTYKPINQNNFPCTLVYTDLTTGVKLEEFKLDYWFPQVGYEYESSAMTYGCTRVLSFHANHTYQITITPTFPITAAEGHLTADGLQIGLRAGSETGTATHILRSPGENLGAVAVVSYLGSGAYEEPTLLWNNEVVPAWWIRDVTDGDGSKIREAVFRRNIPAEGGDAVQLRLRCNPGGEIILKNWGLTLL